MHFLLCYIRKFPKIGSVKRSSPITMNRCIILLLLNSIFVFNIQAATKCNLKAIFQTPRRRNYDEFEILERSNFMSEDPENNQKVRIEPGAPNTLSNAKVLLRLGDFKNAIKKNSDNVNTKITLAGPNHNNYFNPALVHPYYPQVVPQNGYPWNMLYSSPRTSQYYLINRPNYHSQHQVIPQSILNQINGVNQPQFIQKPRIVVNDPIIFDGSVIQHIPTSAEKKGSPSNGLNTMTVIPKILIDTVAKKPAILEELETQKTSDAVGSKSEISQKIPEVDEKLELGEKSNSPESDSLKIVEIIPNNVDEVPTTQNSQPEEPKVVEISPVIMEEVPKQDQNEEAIQIIEITPSLMEESTSNKESNTQGIEAVPTLNNGEEDKKDQLAIEEEIVLNSSDSKPSVEIVNIEVPSEPTEIHNIEHPRVLHPVKLTNNIENVEIVGEGNLNISFNANSRQLIQNCSNSEDFELVDLLQKSLVPFINLKTNEEPKLLVSYPVINNVDKNIPEHPSAIIVQTMIPEPTFCAQCTGCGTGRRQKADIDDLNVLKGEPIRPQAFPVESSGGYQISSSMSSQSLPTINGEGTSVVSGYQMSSASGYYEDPTKKIIYSKPTEITVVPPQVTNSLPNFVASPFAPLLPEFPPMASPFDPSIQDFLPIQPMSPFVPEFLPRRDLYHVPTPGGFLSPYPSLASSAHSRKSKLLDLLKYLLSDSLPIDLNSPPRHVCPYCSNPFQGTLIVKCPHCLKHHQISGSQPLVQQRSCPYCTASMQSFGRTSQPSSATTSCPYCAKYRGELNQISE